MSVLTERKTWKRKQSERVKRYIALRVLTPEQREHVRHVVKHLTVAHGFVHRLARAMGLSVAAVNSLALVDTLGHAAQRSMTEGRLWTSAIGAGRVSKCPRRT